MAQQGISLQLQPRCQGIQCLIGSSTHTEIGGAGVGYGRAREGQGWGRGGVGEQGRGRDEVEGFPYR